MDCGHMTSQPLGHTHSAPLIHAKGFCSVLEPYGSGMYWIVCHILAFLGAFFCLLMTSMYDQNIAITGGNNKQNPRVSPSPCQQGTPSADT